MLYAWQPLICPLLPAPHVTATRALGRHAALALTCRVLLGRAARTLVASGGQFGKG
jgi:hypothetical protein